jgi:ABC-type amino acid transport substrate-binding protein
MMPNTAVAMPELDAFDGEFDPTFDFSHGIFIAAGGIAALQRHVLRAGMACGQSMAEIEDRSDLLGNALLVAEEHSRQSMAAATGLEASINAEISVIVREIRQRLASISSDLETKVADAGRVLSQIRSIGSSINLLALNAAIEAAHAGEQGRGFEIVAREIRDLAQRTMDGANNATKSVDLSEVREAMAQSVTKSNQLLDDLVTHVSQSLSQVRSLSNETDKQLQEITENNRVIREAVGAASEASRRMSEKASWCRDLSEELSGCAATADADAMVHLLDSHHLNADPFHDHLDMVLKRGSLRIAIDPALLGLSFRARPGEPLRGLDVEYATAFARWLGVRCEFIAHPWDRCIELLDFGRTPGEAPIDLMWCGLPPSAAYEGMAFSEAYTYFPYVLARQRGNDRIRSLKDLDGQVLGCINDPAALDVLEAAGVRWRANAGKPGGRVRLANLIAFGDQTRIFEAVANGVVDAFAVDHPVFHWASTSTESHWHKRIDVLPGNIAPDMFHYCVAVKAEASNYRLLAKVNEFISVFKASPERLAIERKWQGNTFSSNRTYRDEEGNLKGEPELRDMYEDRQSVLA